MHRLIIGTYPAGETAGSGEGLWEVFLSAETGELSGARQLVETPSPSFVALHPNGHTVFAVSELDEGEVVAFTLTADGLTEEASRPTLGMHPCHVVARQDQVWVANYSSGTFTALGVDATGAFTGQVQSFGHAGSGPDPDRQEGPHAHYALPAPDGDGAWVVDLGTDEVRRYSAAGAVPPGLAADGIAATLPPGSGPRHGVVHPSGTVVVVGELDSRVHLLRPVREAEAEAEAAEPGAAHGSWEVYASVPACQTPDPGTGSYPSHVALSTDGTRLYVAVRGPDVLSTFAVTSDGAGLAHLTHLADTPVGGVWPRHFAVLAGAAAPGEGGADGEPAGDVVVVANQNSSTLAVLQIDRVTGAGTLTARLDLPAPACVLPV